MEINFFNETIDRLEERDFSVIKNFIENNYNNENCMVQIDQFLQPLIPSYSYDYFNPFWLDESCKFSDNVWLLNLTKNKKKLDFENVLLSDGSKLSSHPDIINIFKLWLIVSVSPTYNNGSFLSKAAINNRLNQIISLINSIIINESKINLLQLRYLSLNENYFINLLINLNLQGFENSFYNFKEILSDYLLENIESVNIEDVKEFEKSFPLIAENYDSSYLDFSLEQVRKSRFFLYVTGGYDASKFSKKNFPTGKFFKSLYKNKTIDELSVHFSPVKCLMLSSKKTYREFNILDNYIDEEDDQVLKLKTIEKYVQSINFLIPVQHFHDSLNNIYFKFDGLNIESIKRHVDLKPLNRFLTPPTDVVFKILRSSFDFIYEYMDDILAFHLDIQEELNLIFTKYKISGQKISLTDFKENTWRGYLPNNLKKLGIIQWDIARCEKNYFDQLRANKSIAELFNILTGCIQVVLGSTMARRQSELTSLIYSDVLVPNDIDPNEHRDVMFNILFRNQKNGIYGEVEEKNILARPILNSVAGIVYKLKMFNEKLKKISVRPIGNSLFKSFNALQCTYSDISTPSLNQNFDLVCDYFQSKTIHSDQKISYRYYLRQHQFRRFFALLFFWSNSFDGLDTLRRFLGHTDVEHLYNYITTNLTGEVLIGAKAKTLTDALVNKDHANKIENIEKLRSLLEKEYKVLQLEIQTETDILHYYSDTENLEALKYLTNIQNKIQLLLENHTIDLQPDFFDLKDENNNILRTYKLILKFKG